MSAEMSDVHDSNPTNGVHSIQEHDDDVSAHAPCRVRATGSREPHRVKFAEERNLYVNCDNTTGPFFRDVIIAGEEDDDATTTTMTMMRTWPAICRGLTTTEVNVHHDETTILKRPSVIRTPRPRTLTTDDMDNPFTRGGELSRKADYILRHSTFSRTGLRILDPDCMEASRSSTAAVDNDEMPDPLPLSPEVPDRNDDPTPVAQANTEEDDEEEGGVGLSDGENGDEPCSVTTSLVSPADRDIDQSTVDSQLTRLNGKHPPETATTRVINSRASRYESPSSSPVLIDSGTVSSSRTKKCSCCLLQ